MPLNSSLQIRDVESISPTAVIFRGFDDPASSLTRRIGLLHPRLRVGRSSLSSIVQKNQDLAKPPPFEQMNLLAHNA